MTLEEIMAQVTINEEASAPRARSITADTEGIILKKCMAGDTELRIYASGYVYYRVGKHSTVFLITDVTKDYSYASVMGQSSMLDGSCFEDDFIYRLILEGEDRIDKNYDTLHHRHTISYSCIAEDFYGMEDPADLMEQVLDEMQVEKLLEKLTDRQKEILKLYVLEDMCLEEIGKLSGKTKQSVHEGLHSAINRMKDNYSLEKFKEIIKK